MTFSSSNAGCQKDTSLVDSHKEIFDCKIDSNVMDFPCQQSIECFHFHRFLKVCNPLKKKIYYLFTKGLFCKFTNFLYRNRCPVINNCGRFFFSIRKSELRYPHLLHFWWEKAVQTNVIFEVFKPKSCFKPFHRQNKLNLKVASNFTKVNMCQTSDIL